MGWSFKDLECFESMEELNYWLGIIKQEMKDEVKAIKEANKNGRQSFTSTSS